LAVEPAAVLDGALLGVEIDSDDTAYTGFQTI
jgi:hypothetical protein